MNRTGEKLRLFLVLGLGVLFINTLFLAGTARGGDPADKVKVTVKDYDPPDEKYYDPKKQKGAPADPNVPGDLPGPPANLPASEAGVATPSVSIKTLFGAPAESLDKDGDTAISKTTAISALVSGFTTAWLPSDADDGLVDHERGHEAIHAAEYKANAEKKVKAALIPLIGVEFKAPNKDFGAARKKASDALTKAVTDVKEKIFAQIKKLDDRYDSRTKRAKNPESPQDASQSIINEITKAAELDKHSCVPDAQGPLAGIGDPPVIGYDAAMNQITITGNPFIDMSSSARDPLCDRGAISIDPMDIIGPLEDGNILLGDSSLRIYDCYTGTVLLDAWLYNLSYGPSNLPDYAGMIVGYLSIDTENNTIGSGFLNGLEASRTAGDFTAFWCYTEEVLLDANGASLIDNNGTCGSIQMGITLPEPAVMAILTLGLAALLYRRR